jgi:hypothetical protein
VGRRQSGRGIVHDHSVPGGGRFALGEDQPARSAGELENGAGGQSRSAAARETGGIVTAEEATTAADEETRVGGARGSRLVLLVGSPR